MSESDASAADGDIESRLIEFDSLTMPLSVSDYETSAKPDNCKDVAATQIQEAAKAERKQIAEAERKLAEANKCRQDEELKRKTADLEANHRQEAQEVRRDQDRSFAKRKQEEANAQHSADGMEVTAADVIAYLQSGISSSSIPVLVEALSAVDAAVASHPTLCDAHPQVAALRNDAHTRAAAVAEDLIKAALALGSSSHSGPSGWSGINPAPLDVAIAGAVSVLSAPHHHLPPFESLRSALANARRVAAYWSLRLRKANHALWTCDEVITAFAAVAHSYALPADSIDAVIGYFQAKLVNGASLAVVGSSTDEGCLTPIIADQLRRARVLQIIHEMCAPPNTDVHVYSSKVSGNVASSRQAISFLSASVSLMSPASSAESKPGASIVESSVQSENSEIDDVVYGPSMPQSSSLSSASVSQQSSDLQNLASRLVDTDASAFEDDQSALSGIFKADMLSFADAVKRCGVKGVAINAMCAAKHGAKMKNHGAGGALTADQIAAIHMYTQACDFYKSLNVCLRNRDRLHAKPFFPYLRLLLEGLRQLPAQKKSVYRGVKLDLSAKFRQGDLPVWWSVTSTSTTMDVLQSKEFCGQGGPRTVFLVEAKHARNIAAFSAFASEEEWILLPGAQLRVKAVVALGGGLHLVQMDEIGAPLSLIEFESDD
jgi:hypothetical protein